MRVIVALLVFLAITALFFKAAESLSPRRLNLISLTYYKYAIMLYLGSSLAFCGIGTDHYLIIKMTPERIDFLYYAVTASGFGLGIIFLFLKEFIFSKRKSFTSFLDEQITFGGNSNTIFTYVMICSIVSLLCTIYTFVQLGQIPVLNVLLNDEADAASIRWTASHAFEGNAYIRNIGMIMLAPLCNFMAFTGWRVSKQTKWAALFAATSVLCVFTLTWDLEKAPLALHVFFIFVLACLIDFKPTVTQMTGIFVAITALVLLGYQLTAGTVGSLSLTTGPLGRLIMTPVSALGLHFEYFPKVHDFLNGESLPSYWAVLFGFDEGWVRSGSVVMQFANPSGVANQTAGVMSAFFIGEAYANWGIPGIVISVIVVGCVIGIVHNVLIKHDKTYFTVTTYCVVMKFQEATMSGGFVDYFSIMTLAPLLVVLLPLLAAHK